MKESEALSLGGAAETVGRPDDRALSPRYDFRVLLIFGARRVLLMVVVSLLLLGSSVVPDPRNRIFFLRFAALGSLALAAALGPWAMRERSSFWDSWPSKIYAAALGGLAAFAVASTVWSATPVLSLQRAAGFALMGCAIVAVGATWSSRPAVLADLSLVAATLWAAIFASLAALVLHMPWAFDVTRLRGVLQNPNTIGVVAALLIPLAAGLAAETHRFARTWWCFVIACAAVALIAAGSRGGLLAVGAGLLAFTFQCRGKSRWYLAVTLAGLLGAAGVLFTPALSSHLGRFLSLDPNGRTAAWSVIVRLWEQRPWLGWGFGSTDAVFPKLQGNLTLVFEGGNAHNAYLQTLFEVGPLGLLLLLTGMAVALRCAFVPAQDFLEAGVFGAMVAGAVNQVFESGLTSPGSIIAFNFWLLAFATVRLGALPASRMPALSSAADRGGVLAS